MKNNYFLALLMASAVIVSCSEVQMTGGGEGTPIQSEERVITLSFDTDTRTSIDGLDPHFNDGDLIMISNTRASQVCTVKVDNGKAAVVTTLPGNLTAVYPSSAADMDGEEIAGIIVPSRQSGCFADANICQATIPEGSASASFHNMVAILEFYVDGSIGVKTVKVESPSSIASDGGRAIIVDPEGNDTINMVTDDPGARLCYIATIGGIEVEKLKFTSETTTQGIVVKEVNTSVALKTGSLFRVFIPYYIRIKVNNNPVTYQKWGYCNVGGFLPEDYGDYYGWGGTETIYGKEYDWVNAPFQTVKTTSWNSTKWTKYLGSVTSSYKDASANDADALKVVLDLQDDIANVRWGGEWRMPTIEEFESIRSGCNRVWTSVNGIEGYEMRTKYGNGASLFFPAAGYHDVDYDGDGSSLWGAGSDGAYWSSSLSKAEPHSAYYCYFFTGTFDSDIIPRYAGQSVRPIIE